MSKRIVCPGCGSTEVKYDSKTKLFHCPYCQTDFSVEEKRKSSNSSSNRSGNKLSNKVIIAIVTIPLAIYMLYVIVVICMNSITKSNEDKKYAAKATEIPKITVTPEVTVAPYPGFEEESDRPVWENVLQDVFKTTYADITKDQIESIRFLGFSHNIYTNSLEIKIGFQDGFNNTTATYELWRLDEDQYEQAYADFTMFQGITTLEIEDEQVDEVLLNSFPDLSQLAVIGCNNPYFLTNLTNLKQLYLEGSSIREYLGYLTNLTSLTLVNCDLDKFTSWMSDFSHLKELNLKGCKETIPIDYSILAGLKELQIIKFNDCEFDYEINGILDIPNLTMLDLSGSKFYIEPDKITLPDTLNSTILDDIELKDRVYEMKDGYLQYVQKNVIPVETIKKLLTP